VDHPVDRPLDIGRLIWANTHPGRPNHVEIPFDRRRLHQGQPVSYADRAGGPPSPPCYRNYPHGEWDDPTWLRAVVDIDHMEHADHIAGVAEPHDYHHKPTRPHQRGRSVTDPDVAIINHLARNNDTALTVNELADALAPTVTIGAIRRHLARLSAAGTVAPMGVARNGARCWGITHRGLDQWRARQVTGRPVG